MNTDGVNKVSTGFLACQSIVNMCNFKFNGNKTRGVQLGSQSICIHKKCSANQFLSVLEC